MTDRAKTTPRDAPTMLRDWIKKNVGGPELAIDLTACATEMERDKAEIKRLRTLLSADESAMALIRETAALIRTKVAP